MKHGNSVARKLIMKLKIHLTPIQLTIDNLKSKYLKYFNRKNKEKYKLNLQTINKSN